VDSGVGIPADMEVSSMNQEELDRIRDAKIAEQQAEIARLTALVGKAQTLKLKVSEKGGVSVYGLNAKWPVTLYGEQWKRLADYMPNVIAFVNANSGKLTTKADKISTEEV
jgi:hypothetical protein